MWHYQILTFFILVILPFFSRQLDPKIPLAIFIFAASLLPIFIKNIINNITGKNLVTYLFLIFLFFASLSTIFSINQRLSLTQLLLYYSYFVVFTSIGSVFSKLREKEKLAAVFLAVTLLLSLISNYNTLVLNYVNHEFLGGSFKWIYFGHNHLSALLLFSIPISFYFLKSYWQDKNLRVSNLFIFFFLILTLYFTFARASLVSLVIAFYLAVLLFRLASKKSLFLGITTHLVIVGIIIAGVLANARLLGIYKGESINSRIPYWQIAIENAAGHPLIGTGPDTYRISNFRQTIQHPEWKSLYAHSFSIQMLSDGGILGLLASLLLILALLWKGAINVRNHLKTKTGFLYMVFWIGVLASALNNLVDFDWQLPTVFLIFWLISGNLVKKPQRI